jgi:TonB family protein
MATRSQFLLVCLFGYAATLLRVRANLITPPMPAPKIGAESWSTDVYDVANVDHPPLPILEAKPDYPIALRKKGISGIAIVDFVVDSSGTVQEARAVAAINSEVAPPCVAAIKKWRFIPGIKSGKAVGTRLLVPIAFAVEKTPGPDLGTAANQLVQLYIRLNKDWDGAILRRIADSATSVTTPTGWTFAMVRLELTTSGSLLATLEVPPKDFGRGQAVRAALSSHFSSYIPPPELKDTLKRTGSAVLLLRTAI